MKKLLRILYRFLILLPAILIQAMHYVLVIWLISDFSSILRIMIGIYQVVSIIYIINKREEANYKVLWTLVMLVFPVVGTYLYLIAGNHRTSKPIEKRIKRNSKTLKTNSVELKNNSTTNRTLLLVSELSKMPIIAGDESVFYKLGEDMQKDMLEDLKQAKHFIFLEYFIIENGKFWGSIVDILKQKVAEGVCVKVLYDDIGSIATYSLKSRKKLKDAGIDIVSFNPVIGLHFSLNNRDHRKILVIDNKVAYSGGVNIADEYINEVKRFGHWKDIGFKVTGEAVKPFTQMFTNFWNAYSKQKVDVDKLYRPVSHANKRVVSSQQNSGLILSYYDSPMSDESTSNNYFINILSTAKKYAYFYTPYLILNDSLKNAFIQASQRKIDVRIIVPEIPDKKHPYMLTIKNAEELSHYGVKVYKYSDGFIHAKASVVDDRLCSIGTVNLDYRSLFLHYENNTIFTGDKMVAEVKNDFLETQGRSERFVIKKQNVFVRIYRAILNIFAPLL